MTQFNPDVQKEGLQHYWNWSKPVPQPSFAAPQGNKIPFTTTADTSKGELLKGIGDVAGSAVQGADSYLKQYYTEVSTNAASAIRDEATAETEQKVGTQPTLLGGSDPLPAHIQGSMDKAQSLQDAQDGGKLPSDTYYKMRLAASQKDLRASTPQGYWPQIDKGFSDTTGMDPANAYLAAKMRDLHSMLSANDKDKSAIDKQLTDMYSGGDETAAHVLNARKAGNGPSDAATRSWIAKKNADEYKLKQLNQQYSIREKEDNLSGNGDLLKNDADRESSQYLNTRAHSYYDGRDLLLEPVTGRALDIQHSAKDAAIYAQNINAKRAQFEKEADSYGDQPVYKDFTGHVRTRRDILGDTVWDQRKKSAMSVFDVDMRLVKDADLQTSTYFRRNVQGAEDESKLSVYDNKDVGEFAKKTFGFQHWFGAEWMKDYAKGIQQTQFPEAVKKWLGVDTVNTGTATPEKPWVASQTFSAAYKDGFRDPAIYSYLLNQKTYDGLLSPSTTDEGKRRFIDHFYLPQNSRFLDLVTPNSQFKVFDQLSQPKVTDQVFAAGTPEQLTNYRNSVEGWFKKVTGTNIQTVNDAIKGEQTPIPLTFHWNDEVHNLLVSDAKGRVLLLNSDREPGAAELNTPYVRSVKKAVRELNQGLSNLSYMYSKEGKPGRVDGHLFDTLQAIGFDIDPEKMTGLPADISRAMRASRPRQHANPEAVSTPGGSE